MVALDFAYEIGQRVGLSAANAKTNDAIDAKVLACMRDHNGNRYHVRYTTGSLVQCHWFAESRLRLWTENQSDSVTV